MRTLHLIPGETENKVINLYPEITGQVFDGFGGAITESAASVYAQMSDSQKRELLTSYFAPDRMNYQFVRIPIDSCDFSIGQYCGYTEIGAPDFSRIEKWILPMLRDAEKTAGRKIPVMLSPWSPPAFMKTNGLREQGGKLRSEYADAWADYLCRYAQQMRNLGFVVSRMSLQNEPKAVQTWDSCIFTAAEEKEFLLHHMYPAIERYGLTDIEIYLWDHNKERVYEWMRDIIDDQTRKMVAGACFHWYSGDHFEALDLCRRQFPDKKLIVSESCIEYRFYEKGDATGSAVRLSHELTGDLNHGISAFYDWNLLLDETGGPNYVGNLCLAPFLFDRKAKKLIPQLLQTYYETFASAIPPQSVRIAVTRFSDDIDATAWRRPDGTVSLVLLNRTGARQSVIIRMDDLEAEASLAPYAIEAFLID